MRLEQLIAKLQDLYDLHGDLPVKVSADAEGNDFGNVHDITITVEDGGGVTVVIWPV